MWSWILGIIVFLQNLPFTMSVLGGILYRLGGAGDVSPDDGFNWLRSTLTRDIGMSVLVGLMTLVSATNVLIGWVISMGLTYAISCCGYGGEGELPEDQSFLYRIFGKYVFVAVGLGFGFALLPYAIHRAVIGMPVWDSFCSRTLVLAGALPLIHVFRRPLFGFNSAQVEEFLRGFVIILSTVLCF